MIRNICLILLLNSCSLVSFSQSKQDTEKWILEKLNKYNKELYTKGFRPYDKGSFTYAYRFSFDSYYLIISDSVRYYSPIDNKLSYRYEEIKVPVYDIIKVTCDNTYDLYLRTSKETVITASGVSDVAGIGFNIEGETDLENRLAKAFIHLKQFYKKPQSTETF